MMPESLSQTQAVPGCNSTEQRRDSESKMPLPDLPTSPAENQNSRMDPSSTTSSTTAGSSPIRDSTWLQVEACRDFRRDTCPRGDQCRFAHPDAKIIGKDGKVTCCYDFLKGRCHRDYCKYYHPPAHIKERLVSAGRQFGAMMSRTPLYSAAMPQFVASDEVTTKPVGPVMSSPYGLGYPERIPICPDFVLGQCQAPVCPCAHPGPQIHINADQTVTICRNFMKGLCLRGDNCRYYHFPAQNIFQQPFVGPVPPNQIFPVGQPAVFPMYYPAPPVPSFIPMGIPASFPAVPQSPPLSMANVRSAVPVLPMVSPVTSCSTSVLANPFVPQAQPVSPHQAGASLIVATAPVSIIDTGTAALHSSQGETDFPTLTSLQQIS